MAGDDFWMALIRCMSGKGSYGRGYWLLMSLIRAVASGGAGGALAPPPTLTRSMHRVRVVTLTCCVRYLEKRSSSCRVHAFNGHASSSYWVPWPRHTVHQ